MKKLLSLAVLSALICGTAASCGSSDSSSSSSSSSESATEAPTEAATTEAAEEATTEAAVAVAVDDVEFEDAVAAESGDAYLAIVDDQWWIQYWGKNEDMLTYDAGVVPITGNGDYTVSVTADTNGFRFDTTGDVNDQYTPSGLSFMSVMIKDGETKFPGAVITVNSVKIDGKELTLSGKPYTSSDDGIETRANLYNEWVEPDKLPEDARCADGPLYTGEGDNLTPAANIGDYTPQAVNKDDFNNGWTTVEVNFTVSGIE